MFECQERCTCVCMLGAQFSWSSKLIKFFKIVNKISCTLKSQSERKISHRGLQIEKCRCKYVCGYIEMYVYTYGCVCVCLYYIKQLIWKKKSIENCAVLKQKVGSEEEGKMAKGHNFKHMYTIYREKAGRTVETYTTEWQNRIFVVILEKHTSKRI